MSDYQAKPALLAAQDTTDQTFQVRRDTAAEEHCSYDQREFTLERVFKAGADWAREFTQNEYSDSHRYREALSEIDRLGEIITARHQQVTELKEEIERLTDEGQTWQGHAEANHALLMRAEEEIERLKAERNDARALHDDAVKEHDEACAERDAYRAQALKLKEATEEALADYFDNYERGTPHKTIEPLEQALREFAAWEKKEQGE